MSGWRRRRAGGGGRGSKQGRASSECENRCDIFSIGDESDVEREFCEQEDVEV